MRPTLRTSTSGRMRLAVIGLASAGLIASALSAIAPASAAGLNLHKSLTALSGTLSESGSTLSLSVNVRINDIPIGLGLTPTGTVTFTDDVGDNLGSAALPTCLLTACNVTKTVATAAISSGATKVTATYGGDLILSASSASIHISVTQCDADSCSADVENSSTEVDASSDADSGTIEAMLGGPDLPCSLGAGSVGTVNGVGLTPDDGKDVFYSLSGAAANTYVNLDSEFDGDGYWICWVSPNPFMGFSDNGSTTFPQDEDSYSDYGAAPKLTSGSYAGDYVALLAQCGEGDPAPCWNTYNDGISSDIGPYLYVDISAPASDPHFGG
jgi:hypothetical protein